MTLIMVVDDDQDLAEMLGIVLTGDGYQVDLVNRGDEVMSAFALQNPDLVLLDVMLPGMDGVEVCKLIRTVSMVPIVMLTAKGEEADIVTGLQLGADDYITKPFGVRELLARIAAVRRRAVPPVPVEGGVPAGAEFSFGAVMVNRKTMRTTRGRKSDDLTARELRLIELFLAHPDEVLSRDRLLNEVWGVDYLGTTRTLDQHIVQLRKKVEKEPDNPTTIQTVHGVGYRYVR